MTRTRVLVVILAAVAAVGSAARPLGGASELGASRAAPVAIVAQARRSLHLRTS
jgi:hypothetical protein